MKKNEAFPIAATAERVLDRRRFLCAAGGAAAVALLGEWGAAGWQAAEALRECSAHWNDADALAVGEARAVQDQAGHAALVVRLDETTVVGFERRCPHLGCPVMWSRQHMRFECHCHDAAFDARSGAVLYGPPQRGLTPVSLQRASAHQTTQPARKNAKADPISG